VYTSRRLTSILIFALLIQTFAPLVPSVRAEASSPSSPHAVGSAHRVDGFGFDHTPLGPESEPGSGKESYLPVIYKTDTRVMVASSPANTTGVSGVAASQAITNGEDIVYLINSRQMGRTENFSDISPIWTFTQTFTFTPTDIILDPQDPYNTAWAAAYDGIWQTKNLNSATPSWTQVRSMAQISAEVAASGITNSPIFNGVARIASDASRPQYFFVVLASAVSNNGYGPSGVVGWTSDNGNHWIWRQLPRAIDVRDMGLGTKYGYPPGLALSQDGSGRIWLLTHQWNNQQVPHIVYSSDFGNTWKVIWYNDTTWYLWPVSLYYARGAVFVSMQYDSWANRKVGRLVDTGEVYWTIVNSAINTDPKNSLHTECQDSHKPIKWSTISDRTGHFSIQLMAEHRFTLSRFIRT